MIFISIFRNFCPLKKISFQALEMTEKPLKVGQFSKKPKVCLFVISMARNKFLKRTKVPDSTPQGLFREHHEAIVLMQ